MLAPIPLTPRALAGLETGILGAILVLGWFSLDAVYQGQHWYAFPNLWSTAFYGQDAFRMRLGWATLSGLAFHLAQLGIAGALFGILWQRMVRLSLHVLAGVVWSCLWYFVMTVGFWKYFAPFVPRLMPQPATLLGVFLFGVFLSRTPRRTLVLANQIFNIPLPVAPVLIRQLPPPLPATEVEEPAVFGPLPKAEVAPPVELLPNVEGAQQCKKVPAGENSREQIEMIPPDGAQNS